MNVIPTGIPAPRRAIAALVAATVLALAACGSEPDLAAVENRTGVTLTVEITEIPNDRPLDTGETRAATVPADIMYQTELVEITSDTSARIRVLAPDGAVLCEQVATGSEPAPRLLVEIDGCSVDPGPLR